ncbi:MAG TPA: hypothetical protein VIG33_17475 [Pseudobdellovibrionaceae bacterium]|jgi:hypothetical protein
MKPLFLLMTLIISQGQAAFADSFSIIKDGKNYLCTSTNDTPEASGECIAEAYAGPFFKDEAITLCTGAHSTFPAKCAVKAYAELCTKEESIRLCTGAESMGPVECFNKAYAGAFNKDESLTLCKGNGTVVNADCALKAYAGPYSKKEALRICKNEAQLLMRSLNLMQHSAEIQQKVKLMKLQPSTSAEAPIQ